MPVLNERAYLEHAVASVLGQDLDVPAELVLALGPSTDGTTALAERLAAADERIRLVANPAAHIPVGLNAAIRASRYGTVIRVDAHSELAPGYAARALETLERTGAANVGGVMHAEGRTPFQKAVARLYNSPVGLGGGAYHGGAHEGEAESAYLGVMRRDGTETTLARRMIAAQATRAQRLALADDVIVNDGPLCALEQAVARLDLRYRQLRCA